MAYERPDNATVMQEPHLPHAEIIDRRTAQVWQTLAGCSSETLAELDVPEEFGRIGSAAGAMDAHWFDRSPGASENGPMAERTIAGLRWVHCAIPGGNRALPFGKAGPVEIQVDKHHGLLFHGGRTIPILRASSGEVFVHVVTGRAYPRDRNGECASRDGLEVPADWRFDAIRLESDWIVRLPSPTRTLFFPTGDSFQGPIPLPSTPAD